MPVGASEDPLDVIPCDADPMYDCVRVGSPAHTTQPLASPPPDHEEGDGVEIAPLCPPGYVPRRRRRPRYELRGKELG